MEQNTEYKKQFPLPPINLPSCKRCHVVVREMDYFCFNCGQELRTKPLSITLPQVISIVLGSIFLPPIGIIWGIRYLKEQNSNAKILGSAAIIITVVVLFVAVLASIQLIQTIENQVNSQLQNLQMF